MIFCKSRKLEAHKIFREPDVVRLKSRGHITVTFTLFNVYDVQDQLELRMDPPIYYSKTEFIETVSVPYILFFG